MSSVNKPSETNKDINVRSKIHNGAEGQKFLKTKKHKLYLNQKEVRNGHYLQRQHCLKLTSINVQRHQLKAITKVKGKQGEHDAVLKAVLALRT